MIRRKITEKVKFYRTMTKIDKELSILEIEIIIGCLLGDLTIEKPSLNHNSRLQFKQSTINEEYIWHLYAIFKEYTGSKPIILSRYDKRINKQKTYTAIKFQTYSLEIFNKYKALFYNENGQKQIPANIDLLLTERGLAYWFMDDGYKKGKGFYFCTESYSDRDRALLLNVLQNKFKLFCSGHKTTNGIRIYIQSKSRDKFIGLISPYIIDNFKYKLVNS